MEAAELHAARVEAVEIASARRQSLARATAPT